MTAFMLADIKPGHGPIFRTLDSFPVGRYWPASAQAWARSSVVEHTLHTGGVAGSIPAAPTTPRR
jgi:hypothetical protein